MDPKRMIIIEDRSRVPHHSLWAQDIKVDGHKVVGESYIVWNVEITTIDGAKMKIWRRYADMGKFREELLEELPREYLSIPSLPPKSTKRGFGNEHFLKAREEGLDYFLKCVILNPYLARSHAAKRFINGSNAN